MNEEKRSIKTQKWILKLSFSCQNDLNIKRDLKIWKYNKTKQNWKIVKPKATS